eukprot:2629810-Amphidinium_carterae.1
MKKKEGQELRMPGLYEPPLAPQVPALPGFLLEVVNTATEAVIHRLLHFSANKKEHTNTHECAMHP